MSESNITHTAEAGARNLKKQMLRQRSGAETPVRQLAPRLLSLDIGGLVIALGQGNNSIVNICTCGNWDVILGEGNSLTRMELGGFC